jgi:hypothetical protein
VGNLKLDFRVSKITWWNLGQLRKPRVTWKTL